MDFTGDLSEYPGVFNVFGHTQLGLGSSTPLGTIKMSGDTRLVTKSAKDATLSVGTMSVTNTTISVSTMNTLSVGTLISMTTEGAVVPLPRLCAPG